MKIKLGRSIRNFVIFVAILVVMVQGAVAPASNEPSYIPPSGAVDVDGNPNEWNLTNDFFADMYKSANNNGKDIVLSKLYLRYDCTNGTLYAMVLLEDDYVIDANASVDNHYIKLGNNIKFVDGNDDNDGNAPDFHYIFSGNDKIGWEASTPFSIGSYDNLNVHTQVYKDETSAVESRGIPLTIICGTNDIPEFPTIALPVAAILGLMFIFGRKREL